MIKALTPIRFALCMMIFFHHAYGYDAGGAPAVAAFFMLSGFCMTLGYKERILSADFDYFGFIKKRLCKIYPIHWITLLAKILIAILLTQTFIIEKRIFIANLFLLQSWIPDQSYYFSYNAIAWYLSTALFAYLCFPMLVMFFGKLNHKQRLLVLCGILLAYSVTVIAMPSVNYHAMIYIHPCSRLCDFIIGMFLADFYMDRDWCGSNRYKCLINIGIISSFVALNVVSVYTPFEYRSIGAVYWIPAAFLILLTSISEKSSSLFSKCMSWKGVQIFTQCAFSLMMWSKCVIIIFRGLNIQNGMWAAVVMFVGTYAIAQLSYYMIERNMTTWIINKVK